MDLCSQEVRVEFFESSPHAEGFVGLHVMERYEWEQREVHRAGTSSFFT
jgi:hypothetical protein